MPPMKESFKLFNAKFKWLNNFQVNIHEYGQYIDIIKKVKQEIEDETPLTHEESKNIRKEITGLEIEFENEIARKNSEIQRLKDMINDLNTKSKKPSLKDILVKEENKKSKFICVPEKLNDEQLDLLKLVDKNTRLTENNLIDQTKLRNEQKTFT